MIKKYFNFRYFFLLESLLKIDKELHLLVSQISDKDPVAKMLLALINQDITTNVNYLKPSDKNDDVKFVNDTQVKRFVDIGQDPFDRATNSAKIGRTVRQILTANNISVTDQQIEKFVNTYKNAWDKKFKKTGEGFHLISGEDIKHWYLESNYVPGGGTLNNSCMRYNECQKYFNIYTDNPEVCQLLVLIDDRDRLLGRALLWKLKPGTGIKDYFLDRIYTRFDNDAEKFADWFKEFLKVSNSSTDFNSHYLGNTKGLRVQLKNWKFEKFPYMDSFPILDFESGELMTYDGADTSKLQFHIQSTGGVPNVPNHEWSESYKKWFHASECAWIDGEDDYYPLEDCIKDYQNNWILKNDSKFSDFYNSYIRASNAVKLDGFGLVDKEDIIDVYDEVVDGRPLKRKKFLRSELNNSDYVKIEQGWNHIWVNKKYLEYDAANHDWILKGEDFDEKYTKFYLLTESPSSKLDKYFKMSEIDGSFESWGISDGNTKTPIYAKLYSDLDGKTSYYAIDEVIKSFELKSSDRYVVVKNSDLLRSYREMIYQYTLDLLNKLNIKASEFKNKLSELNEECSKRLSQYRRANENFELMKNYGTYLNYYNTVISKFFKDEEVLEILESEEVIENFSKWIDDIGNSVEFIQNYGKSDVKNITISKELGKIEKYKLIKLFIETHKYQIIFYSYWVILLDDRSHADDKLTLLNSEKKFDKNFLVNYFCRYDSISGKFAETVADIRRELSDRIDFRNLFNEFNLSIYSEDFDKIMIIYNDFLSKLKS